MKKITRSTTKKAKKTPSAVRSTALGEITDLNPDLPSTENSAPEAELGLSDLEDLETDPHRTHTRDEKTQAFLDLEDLMHSGELDSDWRIELAAKNPNLCRQLQSVAEKNQLEVEEVGEYLNIYYLDYKKTMRPQTDRSLAEIISVYNCLGMAAPLTLGELLSRRPEEIDSLYRQTAKLVDDLPKPEEFQQQNFAQLLVAFARAYSSQLFDDEFMDTLTAYANRSLQQDESTDDLILSLRIVAASRDQDCLPAFMSYHHELAKRSSSSDQHTSEASIVRHYFELHGLDEIKIQGFRDNVFPMLKARDPEVRILEQPHGAWAVNYGDYNLADFVCDCLVNMVTPKTTAELLWADQTILTGDFQRFQQIRYDAAQLQDIIFPNYGFIYDNRPGAHDLLTAMVDFYDATDASEGDAPLEATTMLQKALAWRLASSFGKYYDGFDQYIFDLDNYDRPVHLTDKNGAEYRAPAIEVLRRLMRNTDQTAISKPKTGDIELDTLIDELEIWTDEDDGETKVDWQQTGELIRSLNSILLEKQGNIGLRPSFVATINFAKNLVAESIAGLTAQDRIEMPFDENFKEMLKFRELILAPNKFNLANFEKFWKTFASANPEDVFGMRSSFHLLKQRTVYQLNQLAAEYLKNPSSARLVRNLWHDRLVIEILRLAGATNFLQRPTK